MSHNPFALQKLENQNLQKILTDQIQKCSGHHTRQCPELPDMVFLLACLKRVITQHKSGRDFLQFLHDVEGQEIKSSTFFEAFKSQRRLHTVRESSILDHDLLSTLLTSAGIDHLSQFPELSDYEVFSADGHFIEHASHLKKKHGGNKIYAAGNIFAQNIRNGLIQLLTPVTDGSAKEHELPHFKNAIEIIKNNNLPDPYFRPLSDQEAVKGPFDCLPIRRQGVQFGELNRRQASQLDDLLSKLKGG